VRNCLRGKTRTSPDSCSPSSLLHRDHDRPLCSNRFAPSGPYASGLSRAATAQRVRVCSLLGSGATPILAPAAGSATAPRRKGEPAGGGPAGRVHGPTPWAGPLLEYAKFTVPARGTTTVDRACDCARAGPARAPHRGQRSPSPGHNIATRLGTYARWPSPALRWHSRPPRDTILGCGKVPDQGGPLASLEIRHLSADCGAQ
jgi:hypothetical protein